MMKVTFYCDQGKVAKIDLAITKNEIDWEIVSEKKDPQLKKQIHQWMEDYCARRQTKVKLPLDLESLPAYTQTILLELQKIPFGETSTYQKLAIRTKNPKASRAVGNACGRNPFPLVIPCHRVLKSDGTLGGFAFGTSMKKSMLAFEND
jgi:methylated-DNA-[protein]-cysteine S-methyltransferase